MTNAMDETWTACAADAPLRKVIEALLEETDIDGMVREFGQSKTRGEKGLRLAYRSSESLDDDTVPEHAITGPLGPYWYVLRSVASERYCRAKAASQHNTVDGVLCSFVFKENGVNKARAHGVPTYIGEGLISTMVLSTRAADPEGHRLRDRHWYSPSVQTPGLSLEVLLATTCAEGTACYFGYALTFVTKAVHDKDQPTGQNLDCTLKLEAQDSTVMPEPHQSGQAVLWEEADASAVAQVEVLS